MFGFLNSDQFILAISLALAVLAITVLLEGGKSKFRPLRILSLLLAIISVLAIYLRPFYYAEADLHTTLVITDGSSKEDSLRQAHPGSPVVYWSDTTSRNSLTDHLVIDGYGIPTYDQWKVSGKEIDLTPAALPKGIIDSNFPQEVYVGDTFKVNLLLNNMQNQRIKLHAYGKPVDSVAIDQSGLQSASLSFSPTVAGRFVFNLTSSDSISIINEYPIPVEVLEEPKLSFLIVNDQPGYEFRFLKNYLQSEGHQLAIRTKITTDRYRYENIGIEARGEFLSTRNLEQMDVIVVSAIVLAKLNSREQRAIKNSVEKEGKGLILLPPFNQQLPRWLDLSIKKSEADKATFDLLGASVEMSFSGEYFQSEALDKSIIKQNNDETLALASFVGNGKVAATTLTNTYQLVLDGDKMVYDYIWNEIIESALIETRKQVRFSPTFTRKGEPMEIKLIGFTDPEVTFESQPIGLRQQVFVEDRWEGRLWPKTDGWQTVTVDDESHWFYTYKENNWVALRDYQTLNFNKGFLANNHTETLPTELKPVPISIWWFLLLFLLSMGYLWLEPKLR